MIFLATNPFLANVRLMPRVTSLEQLSLAEFSGEYARSKVYENDHKNVLGIWLDLVSNVKYSTILIFKVIFLCQKLAESF